MYFPPLPLSLLGFELQRNKCSWAWSLRRHARVRSREATALNHSAFQRGGEKHRCYFHRADSRRLNISVNLKVLTVGRFPLCPGAYGDEGWGSVTKFGLSLSLSAQHGGDWGHRVDSKLSGLRYQQTGGGCTGRRREDKVSSRERTATFRQAPLFFFLFFQATCLDWKDYHFEILYLKKLNTLF